MVLHVKSSINLLYLINTIIIEYPRIYLFYIQNLLTQDYNKPKILIESIDKDNNKILKGVNKYISIIDQIYQILLYKGHKLQYKSGHTELFLLYDSISSTLKIVKIREYEMESIDKDIKTALCKLISVS